MKKEKMEENNNNNHTRWIHLRLSLNEYQKIRSGFNKSTCRKLSEYVRKHLLNKPITTKYRNQSLDEFMWEMIRLRNELNSIGNNLNQIAKKINTLKSLADFKVQYILFELHRKILFDKIDFIGKHTQKIAEQWLQS